MRTLLAWLASTVVAAVGVAAYAQTPPADATQFPSQTVRIIVPFSAGSITDLLARTISDRLADMWQQQVIVENRPGIAGTAAAAKMAADGHSLLLVSNGHATVGTLNKNLSFDPVKDFSGVIQLASVPLFLVVPPDFPARSLREFIAAVKAKPGAYNFASSGTGSTAYTSALLFNREAGINLVHVPYKGAPESMTSIMRGDAHLFFAGTSISLDLVQTNKVRALAITPRRVVVMPEVPTVAEAGVPSYSYDAWFGLLAPAGTPRATINRINRDVAKVLQLSEVRTTLAAQGVEPVFDTAEKFDELIRSDTDRFAKILRDTGMLGN